MVSTVQSYQLNSKSVDIDLERVPTVSNGSKEIFTKQFSTYLPPSLHTAASLTDRVDQMELTAKLLAQTKESSTKDKILICLATALQIASLAAVIFAAVAVGGDMGPLIGIFGGMGIMMISMGFLWNAMDKLGCKIDEGVAFGAALGFGFIIPPIEVLTRVNRLEGKVKEQQREIEEWLSSTKKINDRLLPENYQFFKEHSLKLLEKLQEKIEQSEQSLAAMQQLVERSPSGENELSDRISALQKARDELNAQVEFYRQFDR